MRTSAVGLERGLVVVLLATMCGCVHVSVISPRTASPSDAEGIDALDLAHVGYVGSDLELDTLRQGVRAFRNRNYTFCDIPEELRGLLFTRPYGGGERGFPIMVHSSGVLLAAVMAPTEGNDNQFGSRLMKSAGWSPTPWHFRYTDRGSSKLRVWKKTVEQVAVELIPPSPHCASTPTVRRTCGVIPSRAGRLGDVDRVGTERERCRANPKTADRRAPPIEDPCSRRAT